MIRKRPEKDLENPPGQIVNDITLEDYYKRKGYLDEFVTCTCGQNQRYCSEPCGECVDGD
jgi:hypothetical protein